MGVDPPRALIDGVMPEQELNLRVGEFPIVAGMVAVGLLEARRPADSPPSEGVLRLRRLALVSLTPTGADLAL